MPTLSTFYGIVSRMYYDDHAPPHLHAVYGSDEALVALESLEVLEAPGGDVLRLYGGGAIQVLAPTSNTAGREVQVGGGGQFGFEFFHSPCYSFFLEVGGQGGLPSPGATVLAGMIFYPWTR